jgi:hypothetical protein
MCPVFPDQVQAVTSTSRTLPDVSVDQNKPHLLNVSEYVCNPSVSQDTGWSLDYGGIG